jgi:hypothetical protein
VSHECQRERCLLHLHFSFTLAVSEFLVAGIAASAAIGLADWSALGPGAPVKASAIVDVTAAHVTCGCSVRVSLGAEVVALG